MIQRSDVNHIACFHAPLEFDETTNLHVGILQNTVSSTTGQQIFMNPEQCECFLGTLRGRALGHSRRPRERGGLPDRPRVDAQALGRRRQPVQDPAEAIGPLSRRPSSARRGSSRASPLYEDVRKLARELARLGCDIVTGGGPGLMQAANAGAIESGPRGREQSIGIRVDLGFEQATNAFVGQIYQHRTFFSRLHHFVMLSNAFVVVPGGIGTTLETMMIWQLLQVRKLYDTPLILVGPMWVDLVQWARSHMIEKTETELAGPVDMMIPRCVPNVDEAIDLIREHRAR